MTSTEPFHIVCVVGARPSFMKIAPLMRAFGREPSLTSKYRRSIALTSGRGGPG
jgi:hypothetical protein